MRRDPKKIIESLQKNQGAVRKTGRELCISPGTVIFWRTRARSIHNLKLLRTKGLVRKSTAPKKRTSKISRDDREKICKIREQFGFCAEKMTSLLKLPYHYNTVHRFLERKGYIESEVNHRRPRYQETTHMSVKNVTAPGKLQMDVKYVTPELSGLPHTLFLYAMVDIYTRWKQGVILPLLDQSYSIEALKLCLPLFPFKTDFIQTDNGLEFQTRFHEFVTKELKHEHHHIHKSSPNENAVIERSFRTDEEEFFFLQMEKPINEIDLNMQYQKYLLWFNTERPHFGIDLKTPKEKLDECSIC